jgi:hypothetical protein
LQIHSRAIKYLDPHLELLESEIDGLLDFDVQTTLESLIKPAKLKHLKKFRILTRKKYNT